jgi:hypothetical protein
MVEKEQFRKIIQSLSYDFHNEVNFQEALKESHLAYTAGTLSGEALMLVESQRGRTLSSQSSLFR